MLKVVSLSVLIPLLVIATMAPSCGNDNDKKEKFIVIEPLAGFANRMRAIASAYVTAVRLNAKLVIKWDKQAYHMEGVSDIYQLFKPSPMFISFAEFKEQYPDYYEKFMASDVGLFYNEHLDEANAYGVLPYIDKDTHEVIHIVSTTNFKPYNLPFNLYILMYKYFYENLKPVDEIASKVDAYYEANMKGKPFYGVHFRDWSGEVIGDRTQKADYNNLFVTKIDEIYKQNTNNLFFVASNKVDIINTFSAGVATGGKNIFFRYALTSADRNSLEGIREAMVEWYLLGKTHGIVGTYMSSYSEEAAIFTSKMEKFNIGPTGYNSNFHSIFCFDRDGAIFERPFVKGAYDPCVQYSLTTK